MNTRKTKQNTSVTDSSKKRVFVGLSGGVDSAVSAALLLKQGYEVTGVFIKVWAPDFLPCTWREERRDAMRVAAHLDIPFLFFDFEREYKLGVADYMINEYKIGRTPNPDVMCNRVVKFGAFWDKAKTIGADYIATGHYAQNINNALNEGKDKEKDQSYFLWTLTQNDLSHTLFPVGNLEKKEVRELAKKFKLPVSEKKDSQGICFLGDVNIEEFLSHFIKTEKGHVLDINGSIIGTHHGAIYYTLGERHGFEIDKKKPDDGAYYVVSKDIPNNTITVSNDRQEIASFAKTEVKIEKVNWISTNVEHRVFNISARIRYRQKKFKVKLDGNKVMFEEPQTVDAGQSIVFYQLNEERRGEALCLGGAIID